MWNPFVSREERETRSPLDEVQAMARTDRVSQMAEIERMGDVAIVTITVTELIGIESSSRLLDLLEEIDTKGVVSFVIDVQNVQVMDSACLSTLVKASRRQAKRKGRIALVNADRSVQYLFKLTKLDRMFPICSDVMAGINAVSRPVAVARR